MSPSPESVTDRALSFVGDSVFSQKEEELRVGAEKAFKEKDYARALELLGTLTKLGDLKGEFATLTSNIIALLSRPELRGADVPDLEPVVPQILPTQEKKSEEIHYGKKGYSVETILILEEILITNKEGNLRWDDRTIARDILGNDEIKSVRRVRNTRTNFLRSFDQKTETFDAATLSEFIDNRLSSPAHNQETVEFFQRIKSRFSDLKVKEFKQLLTPGRKEKSTRSPELRRKPAFNKNASATEIVVAQCFENRKVRENIQNIFGITDWLEFAQQTDVVKRSVDIDASLATAKNRAVKLRKGKELSVKDVGLVRQKMGELFDHPERFKIDRQYLNTRMFMALANEAKKKVMTKENMMRLFFPCLEVKVAGDGQVHSIS